MRVKERVALITGSAMGLGKAFAQMLASEGAKVVINDVNEDLGLETAHELEEMGHEVIFIKADVTNRSEVEDMMKRAVSRFGKLDILVNNAGVLRGGLIHEMDSDRWNEVLNVHLNGTFNCTHFALKYMLKNNYGKILKRDLRAKYWEDKERKV